MTANIFDISELFSDEVDNVTPIYFDLQSRRQFTHWLDRIEASALLVDSKTDKLKAFVKHLQQTRLPIVFFQGQLSIYPKGTQKKIRDALEGLGLTHEDDDWLSDYDLYASELEKIYFHDEDGDDSKLHSKFLVLARYASLGERLRIITAHSSFKRVMDVDLYMLPNLTGDVNLPANFDLFTDLELHPRLRDAIRISYYNQDYPTVVFEAAKELSQFLRDISGATTDGITLVNDVLDFSKNKGTKPQIILNSFSSTTDETEQKGYHDFFAGIARAVRNPTAHATATDPFITSRFNDLKKTTKLLCFMSLLFEKIDQRTSPV